MSNSLLIIDDEPHLPHQFARFLRKHAYEVVTADSGESGLHELDKAVYDLVLLDMRLPGLQGIEVLQKIHTNDPDLPVIIMTAHGDIQAAVTAMKAGAADYILKGFDLEELLLLVQCALERSALYRELRALRNEKREQYHFAHVVGYSPQMQEIFDLVTRISTNDTASVLITGESGTGKEVIAHLIHEQSPRAHGPFHPINCAALSSTLLESELFGYEQYAFTDAKKQKKGLLELADGGTLFLDEIGEMPVDMQAKLLRVLETHTFYRVGGNKEVRINVRILAATNKDLHKAIKANEFRSDLFYRLAVLHMHLPPLRERPEDILLFAAHFIEDFNISMGRSVRHIHPDAQKILQAYKWHGNVRELRNVIERAMILSSGDELLVQHLPMELSTYAVHDTSAQPSDTWQQWLRSRPIAPLPLEEVCVMVEKYSIEWALEQAAYNRERAIELLGLEKIDQLRYLLRKHKIAYAL